MCMPPNFFVGNLLLISIVLLLLQERRKHGLIWVRAHECVWINLFLYIIVCYILYNLNVFVDLNYWYIKLVFLILMHVLNYVMNCMLLKRKTEEEKKERGKGSCALIKSQYTYI